MLGTNFPLRLGGIRQAAYLSPLPFPSGPSGVGPLQTTQTPLLFPTAASFILLLASIHSRSQLSLSLLSVSTHRLIFLPSIELVNRAIELVTANGPSDRHGQPTTSLPRCLSGLCSPGHWPDRLLA